MSERLTRKMSIVEYNDYRKAQAAGDDALAKRIWDGDYNPDYEEGDCNATDAVIIETDDDDIMNDVEGGLSNKEICEKYGISAQKLGSIKKGAK